LGGGTTQIFCGSKTNPWAREEPLIILKANTPLGFMVVQLSQHRHIKHALKCQPHCQTLEDSLKAFMQLIGHSINDMKNATMMNTQAIAKMETQIGQIASHLGEREK